MTTSVAVPPPGTVAAAPSGTEAAAPSSRKSLVFLLATVLLLGAVAAWGYTQWWVPRQEAQQAAQVKYELCLDEVKAYVGQPSHADRVAQCEQLYAG